MAKIDLEGDYVHVIPTTTEAIRSMLDDVSVDEVFGDKWTDALDAAQSEVYGDETPVSYIVIKVRKA